ncbi:MAG: hypothetical protein AMJ78_08890 [Omnitrophica WOR_2 bacterium SM23_29]|nr:MAG: hypothetical protein AMJ78_08890 [Omnitrophica WOR_2 bacterium SM23_29]
MKLAAHQPNYLPYLGFFHKIYLSDIFVILDTAQFVKSGPFAWMNRNRIRTKDGWIWLTVPVLTKGKFPVSLFEAKIDNAEDWRDKHWKSIYYNYHKALHFNLYSDYFEELYKKKWSKLIDICEEAIYYLMRQLNIKVKTVRASELKIENKGSEFLVEACKRLGADTYIYGKHGEEYQDTKIFEKNNIKLMPQNFKHPRYHQLYEPFIECMSTVDLLFNHGQESADILTGKKAK